MKFIIFPLVAWGLCWGQAADECKPSTLNIPGAPYPCVHADRRVTFRVAAPDAQKVQVRLGGVHDMTRGADGLWMVTIPLQAVGFHYYAIRTLAAGDDDELIVLPAFTGAPQQLWRVEQLSDGAWRIMPKSKQTLALPAVGSSFATLAKFDPKSDKQHWTIKTP